ncbi:MAG: WYL domain-containing protein [Propionibacteriaceae bacterium]|jgi:predicted DNA-binding transcriptional regulator YafY|nr:WYL domain-containing protein [Propionibacteriaceae bacterium]
MRFERLLVLLWLLMSGRDLSAGGLSSELGVSPRTVKRDVDCLSAAGIPVYWERGRSGGPRLLPGFRGILPYLTEGEVQALLVSCVGVTKSLFGLHQDRESAVRKLEASLSALRQDPNTVLARYLLIDPMGWIPTAAPTTIWDLQRIIIGANRCAVRYYSRSGSRVVNHTVDPGGLVNSAGSWYFLALHRGRLRCYNASRIIAVREYGEPSRLPANFVLRDTWDELRATWRERLVPVEVDVRIRARAVPLLHESVRPRDFDWNLVHSQRWLHLRLLFEDFPHAVGVITPLGDDAVVLAPEELRQRIVRRAERLLSQYAATVQVG